MRGQSRVDGWLPDPLNRIPLVIAVCSALLCVAPPAQAQVEDAHQRDVQRLMGLSSLDRDQQSDAFALRLQQHQRELNAAPEDRPRLQAEHAAQNRELERLSAEQRRAAGIADSPSWGPRLDLRPQMERERRQLLDRTRP